MISIMEIDFPMIGIFKKTIHNKKMIESNWKFHGKKYNKLTLKPQAIRQSKAQLKALINKLKSN